jgi:hypothetical protein
MKTLTANRLTDGRVIYRTAQGHWSTRLEEAQHLSDVEADYLLPIAEAEFGIAVSPYLMDVDTDGPAGQKWRRESIRLQGPTTGTTHVLGAA